MDFFHHEINTDSYRFFLILAILVILVIAVIASQLQNTVSDEIFSRAVAFHNCFDQVFRHISIICEQLFSIFGQAIPAARCQVLDNFFHK